MKHTLYQITWQLSEDECGEIKVMANNNSEKL